MAELSIPVKKILDAYAVSSHHPLWDTFEFELECGHKRRKRVYIDQQVPDTIRCASCRDGKPQDFDIEEKKREIVVRRLYE